MPSGPLKIIRPNLHAKFLDRFFELERGIAEAGLPMRAYEALRAPERQCDLYARGRAFGEPGKFVTHARAWESHHQYGLAADFVGWEHDKWLWWPAKDTRWSKFHEIAHQAGLETLSFEKPHVQYPWRLTDLRAGRYPPGGGDIWAAHLLANTLRWGYATHLDIYGIEQPGAPPPPEDRPPLEEVA